MSSIIEKYQQNYIFDLKNPQNISSLTWIPILSRVHLVNTPASH